MLFADVIWTWNLKNFDSQNADYFIYLGLYDINVLLRLVYLKLIQWCDCRSAGISDLKAGRRSASHFESTKTDKHETMYEKVCQLVENEGWETSHRII